MTSRPAPVGTLAIVLHSHLPWLAHHGTWPVGEEWLHEAWAASYLPLVEMLHRLAAEGRRDLLSLGVTPVLAAQLDDPYCLHEHHGWLGRWQLRAEELAGSRDAHLREVASWEFVAAASALEVFERRWRHGGSAALRPLVDAGVVEHLGGPATHPLMALLPSDVASFALGAGLDDAALRLGRRPSGIWLPECAWAPGLEHVLGAHGVGHLMLDGPTLAAAGATTDRPWRVTGSDVVVVGRDRTLTDRVWSSRTGYPRGADYRDFHDLVLGSGLRPSRVTDAASAAKAPYDPGAAAQQARSDAVDFVAAVRAHLAQVARNRDGRPGLAVVAWDTELFGHWWHEGVPFLEEVLRRLPEAGVRVRPLGAAVAEACDVGTATPPAGSWGAGGDFRLWAGEPVRDLADAVAAAVTRLGPTVRALAPPGAARSVVLDELARQTLLAASSDWPFMVSRDSAARYGRERARGHLAAAQRLRRALTERSGGVPGPDTALGTRDHLLPALDARLLGVHAASPDGAGRGARA